MALVHRNGRPRLQRSIRRNGRVTSEYRGSGEIALLMAHLDALDREERDAVCDEEQAELAATTADESMLAGFCERVEDLTRAALYAAGYHRPKRQWRSRRVRHTED
jgi:hypothetical protein